MMKRIFLSIFAGLTALTVAAQSDLFILGGELSNSAATCVADIDDVMPRMKALGLNTVLVPAYWEMMEPSPGQFNFTLIDRTVEQARQLQLKVVFLWFGAWKNSMSCYAPSWFKTDTRQFPRARTASGKPLEIASCFSENVLAPQKQRGTASCGPARHQTFFVTSSGQTRCRKRLHSSCTSLALPQPRE